MEQTHNVKCLKSVSNTICDTDMNIFNFPAYDPGVW